MKKKFLLLALMIFSGVSVVLLSDNEVKACGSNTAPGLSMKKCSKLKAPVEFAGEIDGTPDMFMNPFAQ